MAKNMTRKGLAFGAGAALVASGLVGIAPASAAGIDNGFVSLQPTAGTSYLVLAGSTFDLKSNVVGSLAGTSGRDLKFLVEDSTSKTKFDADADAQATVSLNTLTTTAIARTAGSSTTTITGTHSFAVGDAVLVEGQTGVTDGWYKVQSISTTVSFTITTETTTVIASGAMNGTVKFADADDVDVRAAIVASDLGSAKLIGSTVTVASSIGGTATTNGRLANGTYVVDTNTNANTVDRVLRLVNTDSTVTTSVTVTAWVDDNNNGAIDSTEYASPARTITFHKNADLTVTTTMDKPVLGASGAGAVTGTVAISPELNGQQVGNTDVTAAVTSQDAATTTVTSTYNSTSKVWDISGNRTTVVVGNYSMRASVAASAIGNTAAQVVGAAVAADTKIEMAATVDQSKASDVDAASAVAGAAGANTDHSAVRKGKSANVAITVYGSTGAAVGAGIAVNVAYAAATTTTDWTVNAVKVLDNAATGARVYTTDANGQVLLAVSSTSGDAGDTIKIKASPENLTGAATAEIQLTWQAASYAIVDLNAPAALAARTIEKSGSYTFDFYAGDQWNAPLAGSYRLVVTTSGRTSFGQNVDFAAGVAKVTITDAAVGTGSTITVDVALQKQTSGTWAASSDATAFAQATITASDNPTSALLPAVTYSAGTAGTLTPAAITAWNAETSQSGLTSPAGANIAEIALNGIGLANGDMVTVSGADLWFAYNDGGTVVRLVNGSMTFVAGDVAADKVQIFSNKYVKDAVVTVASRGRSGTAKVTFTTALEGSAGAATGKSFDFTGTPAAAQPGSTFQVVVTLKDAFGNVIDTSTANRARVTYSGPGIVFGNLPTETDASGQMKFAVLLGSNDSGSATITASYDLNADGDVADKDEFATSFTVVVGSNAGAVSTWTKKIDGDSAKIYAKNIVGAGKVQFYLNGKEIAWVNASSAADSKLRTANGASYLVRTVEFAAGKNVLEVYVDGVRTTRTAYTK
jgi:hypothetical protein